MTSWEQKFRFLEQHFDKAQECWKRKRTWMSEREKKKHFSYISRSRVDPDIFTSCCSLFYESFEQLRRKRHRKWTAFKQWKWKIAAPASQASPTLPSFSLVFNSCRDGNKYELVSVIYHSYKVGMQWWIKVGWWS